MLVHGKCYCGEISFEAEIDPARVTICHCNDCQHLTGSAYRVSVPAPASTFKLLSGKPKVFVKTAESGKKRAHSFCSNCGSPVFATNLQDVESYTLRLGGLEERKKLKATRQIWCESANPNFENIGSIPKTAKQ